MLKLIKNCRVYNPEPLGLTDILIGGAVILGLVPHIDPGSLGIDVEIIDADGYTVVPGFIDQHVHINGAGGEAGPASRTPEIDLAGLTKAGITTVIGLLGADGITRNIAGLLTKARALDAEGITAYIYTGGYEIPVTTLTGSIKSDLVFIDKVIGTGEVAIADNRSSQPTMEMLARVASESRIGGLLGNKAGIVHVHVGEGRDGLALLFAAAKMTDIPVSQFVPTHVNRLRGLLRQALEYLGLGGTIDLTAGISSENDSPDALEIWEALGILKESHADLSRVTVSSDANGSIPSFDITGRLSGLGIGSPGDLWQDIRRAINLNTVSLAEGVALITANPAAALKLAPQKGRIAAGSDADLVFLDPNLEIFKVFARGQLMVENKKALQKGFFQQ